MPPVRWYVISPTCGLESKGRRRPCQSRTQKHPYLLSNFGLYVLLPFGSGPQWFLTSPQKRGWSSQSGKNNINALDHWNFKKEKCDLNRRWTTPLSGGFFFLRRKETDRKFLSKNLESNPQLFGCRKKWYQLLSYSQLVSKLYVLAIASLLKC